MGTEPSTDSYKYFGADYNVNYFLQNAVNNDSDMSDSDYESIESFDSGFDESDKDFVSSEAAKAFGYTDFVERKASWDSSDEEDNESIASYYFKLDLIPDDEIVLESDKAEEKKSFGPAPFSTVPI